MKKNKVLYFTGFWYSGATILGRSVVSSNQAMYVGEIRDFWTKGLHKNEKCSCGDSFEDCGFWQKVRDEYFKSFPSMDIKKITQDLHELEKTSNYFKLRKYLKNMKNDHIKELLNTYLTHTEKLYEIISEISGKNIIVDSSRLPARLLALSGSEKIDFYPVYIIRDPRGVINSLIKKDIRDYGKNRHSIFKHILIWIVKNLLSLDSLKKLNSNNTMYLSYKSFTRYPAEVFEKLGKNLNCLIVYEKENENVSLQLEPGHVFTGNRSRHEVGKINITEDIKWMKELSWYRKLIVSVTSLPILKFIVKKYQLE